MDDATFFAEIERLDAEMLAVPMELRQLDIYHALVGREQRDESALESFNKISAWYLQRYGTQAKWDGVIGRQPLLLRGKLHVLEIRHSNVNPKSGLADLLETLQLEGNPTSPEEYRYLTMSFLEGTADFSALHNIEMRPSLLSPEQRSLLRRAWFDLKDATAVIESSSDVQGSIVHSHEAAEKFLKVALIHEGYAFKELGKGTLRHDLNNLIKALVVKHSRYDFLKKPAKDLHSFLDSMSARYTSLRRSLADAVQAFRLALHCVGFIAVQIELDAERGARDLDFELGHYYHDCTGRLYRFCGYEKNAQGEQLCRLFLLEATEQGHTIDALITYKAPCGFHYAEIRDQQTIARLEARYSAYSLKRDFRATLRASKM
jgi:HEPN domain-containing protein